MFELSRIRLAVVLMLVSVWAVGVIWPTRAQTTQVTGKVTLKQADGTIPPAGPSVPAKQ